MNDSKHSAAIARIMIVVTSAPLRSAIRQCLQMLQPGFDYVEAAGGDEALGIARARQVDLVLLDLQLPTARTQQLLDELVRINPKVLVHVLSDPQQTGTVEARLAGAVGVLSKDNLFEELSRLLQALVARRTTDRPAPSA